MASGRLIDYLGTGVIADRPVSLTLHPDTLGLWWATDTEILSAWDGTVWTDVGGGAVAAVDVTYDNTTSGLTATDVQDAIDELALASPLAGRYVNVALSDMTTNLTTGTAVAVWFAPEDGELLNAYIGLHDPSSSGAVTVDMNDSGGSVFTTLPSIDATEATSLTGTNAVLDGTVAFVRGDKFTFDIDAAGTDAKGLQICVGYTPA